MSSAATHNRSISIGPDWFKTVKNNDYSNWRAAWVREAGQNSLDADATKIYVTISFDEERDVTTIEWDDNGCGMSYDTLETRFMAIGGSKKPDGATGGFGIAKLILAFAQKKYEIRTRDIFVDGEGSRYSVQSGLPFKDGMLLKVEMDGDETWRIRQEVIEWATFTTTKCKILLEDKNWGFGPKELTTLTLNSSKAKTDWCKVYTFPSLKEKYGNFLRVRLNGQYMFPSYTGIEDCIVVDLHGKSQDYLTSNRDSMLYTYKRKLDELIEEIYNDPNKLTEQSDKITYWVGKAGHIKLSNSKQKTLKKLNLADLKVASLRINRQNQSIENIKEELDGHSFVILNRTNKKVPSRWIPGQMKDGSLKILNRWINIVSAVGAILEIPEEVVVGWAFSTKAIAMHKKTIEHGHMILLNPVEVHNNRWVIRWRNDRASFYEMVAAAVHEVTHIYYPYHNEGFASKLTMNMAKVINKYSILEAIRKGTNLVK